MKREAPKPRVVGLLTGLTEEEEMAVDHEVWTGMTIIMLVILFLAFIGPHNDYKKPIDVEGDTPAKSYPYPTWGGGITGHENDNANQK